MPTRTTDSSSFASRLTGFLLPSFLGRGLGWGIVLAILVSGGFLWTPGRVLAQGFSDFLNRLPQSERREVEVVTIPVAVEGDSIEALLERLVAARPQAVLVSGLPQELATLEAFAVRHPEVPILVGVPAISAPEDPDRFDPGQAPPARLAWGLHLVPGPDQGVNRSQFWSVQTAQGWRPTLEGRFATDVLGRQPRGDGFQIDFRGLHNRLPKIEAARVLRGEMPDSLVRGKILLIGRVGTGSVVTPLDGARYPVTDLDFHAAALNTLVHGHGLRVLPGVLTFGLLILTATLFYLWLRTRDPLRAASIAILGTLLQACLAWALLEGTGTLWPAFPLVFVQLGAIAVAQLDRFVEMRDLLRLLVLDSGRHIPAVAKIDPEADPETYWGFIGTFLEQFLQVKRSVFLTRFNQDPRVAEVWAFRCDFSAIREQRRDYRREPYAKALKAAGPWISKSRPVLHPEPDEIQFLVPLVAYGDVEGFWAVSVPDHADLRAMEAALKAFSLQIAEMLHARRNQTRKNAQQLRDEYYSSLSAWSALRAVQRHTGELDRNYRMLDALFGRLSTPTAIYDLFGRVVRRNEAMAAFLAREDIPAEGVSLLELVHTLTGAERQEIQAALRQALLHRESQTFRSGGSSALPIRVTIQPLALDAESEVLPEDEPLRPFGLEGLVLELEEQPSASTVDLDTFRPEQAWKLVHEGKLGLRELLDWTREMEHEQVIRMAHRPDRADAYAAFQGALQHVDSFLLTRRLEVQAQGVPVAAHVTANDKDLAQVLGSVLYFLAEDARKDSILRATWKEEPGFQVLDIENEGHGMPQDAFQALMDKEGFLETASLRGLVASRRLLETWGGAMEAESEFGRGSRIRIRLRTLGAED